MVRGDGRVVDAVHPGGRHVAGLLGEGVGQLGGVQLLNVGLCHAVAMGGAVRGSGGCAVVILSQSVTNGGGGQVQILLAGVAGHRGRRGRHCVLRVWVVS